MRLLGYGAYPLVALIAMIAVRVWSGSRWKDVAREIGAGVMVVIAIASALGLWSASATAIAGVAGAQIAQTLSASLNTGGGYLAVGFTLICGLVLMLKQAPTALIHAANEKIKASVASRNDATFDLTEEFAAEPDGLSELTAEGNPSNRGRRSGPRAQSTAHRTARDLSQQKRQERFQVAQQRRLQIASAYAARYAAARNMLKSMKRRCNGARGSSNRSWLTLGSRGRWWRCSRVQ